VRLIVAGAGTDGTAAHARRVPAAMRDRVVFLGAVFEERADLYATARLCIVPARSGTFSIIVLEALAAGVPVVATPFIDGWGRLRHFQPVRVASDFSPRAVARAVLDALAEDPGERIELGREIAAEFDWSRVAQGVIDVYENVLARRALPGRSAQVPALPS